MNHTEKRLILRYPNALEEALVNDSLIDTKKAKEQRALTSFLEYFIKAETNLERLPFFAPWTKSRSKRGEVGRSSRRRPYLHRGPDGNRTQFTADTGLRSLGQPNSPNSYPQTTLYFPRFSSNFISPVHE